MIEILLIYLNHTCEWTHPNMHWYVSEAKEEIDGDMFTGNFLKINIWNGINTFTFVIAVSDEYYPDLENFDRPEVLEQCENLVEYIQIMMIEDVWAPGREQFIFTKKGRFLKLLLDQIITGDWEWNITGDLCLVADTKWHYDT